MQTKEVTKFMHEFHNRIMHKVQQKKYSNVDLKAALEILQDMQYFTLEYCNKPTT